MKLGPKEVENAIQCVIEEGYLTPKVIIAVDLFGQPADYPSIRKIAEKYNLMILEDGAQGFGGEIEGQKACSFGNISTTSFFPAKPLGCYGDGGAIFTDNDDIEKYLRSIRIHGKGSCKYDNIRIGMNSRLDTLQAAILLPKLKAFEKYELEKINQAAAQYTEILKDVVKTPFIKEGFYSSWAQYSVLLPENIQREELQQNLKRDDIPTMVYYPKPMHEQKAFLDNYLVFDELSNTKEICRRILSLPIHPYMKSEDVEYVAECLKKYLCPDTLY